MRTVHWNKMAQLDYYDNIEFLLLEWSEKDAQDFIDEVDKTEFILKQGNVDFQNTDMSAIKRCVICKQISLFYKVLDKNNIEFLRFWNNYQNDDKLKL